MQEKGKHCWPVSLSRWWVRSRPQEVGLASARSTHSSPIGKEEQGTLTREVGCHGGGRSRNFSSEGLCFLSAIRNKVASCA